MRAIFSRKPLALLLVLACSVHCSVTMAQGATATASRDTSDRAMAAIREEAMEIADRARRAGSLDTAPPVLHSFHVTGSADAQRVLPSVDVQLDMTDDRSGIVRLAILFRSPSDAQGVVSVTTPSAPARRVGGKITVGAPPLADIPLTPFSEPGIWQAVLLYAYDANGNLAGYSQNQLQALGSIQFEVRNERYDIVPPVLVGGTIATPQVQLSKPPKGTPPGTLPYVRTDVQMTDSGNGAVSGAYSARIVFCADHCAHSFVTSGVVRRMGQGSATLTTGTQLDENQHTGSYQIFAVTLADIAGNEVDYTSKAFGGDTDFDKFFPDGAAVSVGE